MNLANVSCFHSSLGGFIALFWEEWQLCKWGLFKLAAQRGLDLPCYKEQQFSRFLEADLSSVLQACPRSPAGLLFPDSEIIALRRWQVPAGLEHQPAVRGRSPVGWAGRAGHVQPRAPEVRGCRHRGMSEKRVAGTHTSICSAKRSAADDHGLVSVCLIC